MRYIYTVMGLCFLELGLAGSNLKGLMSGKTTSITAYWVCIAGAIFLLVLVFKMLKTQKEMAKMLSK